MSNKSQTYWHAQTIELQAHFSSGERQDAPIWDKKPATNSTDHKRACLWTVWGSGRAWEITRGQHADSAQKSPPGGPNLGLSCCEVKGTRWVFGSRCLPLLFQYYFQHYTHSCNKFKNVDKTVITLTYVCTLCAFKQHPQEMKQPGRLWSVHSRSCNYLHK